MIGFRVKIVEITDHAQPRWVRCKFLDANNQEWTLIEKLPVISNNHFSNSIPTEGFIACTLISQSPNGKISKIDTNKPWGIESESGQTIFEIFSSELIDE